MQEGTIATLITDKGFGFIKVQGVEKDVFFHSKELADITFDSLREGDALKFEIVTNDRGPEAKNVSKA